MKFIIATVEFWENIGFNTEHWRKSVDMTKAMVHLEYAKVLLTNFDNVEVYISPSTRFDELMHSKEWCEEVDDIEEE